MLGLAVGAGAKAASTEGHDLNMPACKARGGEERRDAGGKELRQPVLRGTTSTCLHLQPKEVREGGKGI